MSAVSFTKMQGIGNDFIVIDDREEKLSLTIGQVVHLCDRRFGIGADGVMLIRNATQEGADFAWWFVNNDGSVPEMCGNGSRCFARYVYEHNMLPAGAHSFTLETLCGLKPIEIMTNDDGSFAAARVNMGVAQSSAQTMPTTLANNVEGNIFGVSLTIESGETLKVNGVNVGNPHLVMFKDDNPDIFTDEVFDRLGPLLETDEHFPQKTNVEFIELLDSGHIKMRVWERGVGETKACGTGACASAFAAYKTGRTGNDVTVSLLGGDLRVEITPKDELFMTGFAQNVFTGSFDATI